MFNDFNILNFSNLINEKCNNVQIKTFKKGQTITEYLYKYHQICILLEGSAELIRYDLNGGRTIIGNFSQMKFLEAHCTQKILTISWRLLQRRIVLCNSSTMPPF